MVVGSLTVDLQALFSTGCNIEIDTTDGPSTFAVNDLVMASGSIQEIGFGDAAKVSIAGTGSSLTNVVIGDNAAGSVVDIDLAGSSILTLNGISIVGGSLQEIGGGTTTATLAFKGTTNFLTTVDIGGTPLDSVVNIELDGATLDFNQVTVIGGSISEKTATQGIISIAGTDSTTPTTFNGVTVTNAVAINLLANGYLIIAESTSTPFGATGVTIDGPGVLYFNEDAWLTGVAIGGTTAVPVEIYTAAAATTVTVSLTNVQIKGSIQEATGSAGTAKLAINGILTSFNDD